MRRALTLAVCLVAAVAPASAQLVVARVPNFGPLAAERTAPSVQETEVWCWAASIQTILRHYGIERSQASIVQATYGLVGRYPARDPNVYVPMLNGFSMGSDGSIAFTQASMAGTWISSAALAQELNSGHPVLVWHRSGPNAAHVVVLFEAGFHPNGYPIYYRYWDPYPGRGYQQVNAAAFNQVALAFNLIRGARVSGGSAGTSAGGDSGSAAPSKPTSELLIAIEALAEKAETGADEIEDLREPSSGSRDSASVGIPGAKCTMPQRESLRGLVSCDLVTFSSRSQAVQRYEALLPEIRTLLVSRGWVEQVGTTDAETPRARSWRKGGARIDLEVHHFIDTDYDVSLSARGARR